MTTTNDMRIEGERDSDALAAVICAASRDADNWRWRNRDDSCAQQGFGADGHVEAEGPGMWCGTLRVPGHGKIGYAACLSMEGDDLDTLCATFGSGCLDADLGGCRPEELRDAAIQALRSGELTPAGLCEHVRQIMRDRRTD